MSRLLAVFSFLCVSILALFLPLTAFATEPALEVLEEVVVSSTRLPGEPIEARTLPAKVTVITTEEIQRAGAKSVQEAIQYATGIVMYDQVGNAFQQTVDLRGFNGQPVNATTVFVDGVRVNEPDFNTVNFDLIPVETIERIEILPGASAIYGKNALGGVINIITKRGGPTRLVVGETMFGSFHRERYNVNTSGPLGKFDYYANFTRETENGFRDESDARISRLFGKFGYRPTSETDFTLSYTYVKSRLLQAGSLPLSVLAINRRRNFTPGDFFDSESNSVRLTGRQRLPLGFSLNANLFYRHLGQELFTVSQPFSPGGTNPTSDVLIESESKGGTLQVTHEAALLKHRNVLILGSEFARNNFGSRPPRRSTNEDVLGVFAQDTLNLTSEVLLTVGVRYDHDQMSFLDNNTPTNSGGKRFRRATPRAGVTYLVTPQTNFYFNYSEGFRVPTFFELFALGTFGSNPNLRPVRSRNYEVGVKHRISSWGEANVALFRADLRDEILLVCGDPFTCGSSTFAANQNIDKSRRQGVEATFKGKYNQYLDGALNYTFTEATIESDLTLNPFFFGSSGLDPYIEQVQPGSTFPLVPKHRIGFTGNYHPTPAWILSLTGLYVSSQFHLNDEQNIQPRVPGYFLLNGRVAYEKPVPGGRLAAFLLVNNLLDQKYSTSGIIAANNLTGGGAIERFVVPAPGIAFYGGLSYRFESF
jgi:outer membrane receptor protein involved in Fe transport